MQPLFKKSLLFIVVVLALMVSAMGVTPAFADDETPPPPATEESVVAPESAATEESVLVGGLTDPATEPPATVVPEDPAPGEAVATEAPLMEGEAEESSDLPSAVEEGTIGEILEAAPEETQVVVLDEHGEALPLVSEAAAEIVAIVDPVWCPEGQDPGNDMDDGIQNCSNKFATPQDLIDDMGTDVDGTYDRNGTIYFTANPGGAFLLAPGSGTLDAAEYDAIKENNLTLQGGWNGLSGSGFTLSGQTNFGPNPVQIGDAANPWVGNLIINNIMIDGSATDGLTVYTEGDVALHSVTSTGNAVSGAYVESLGDVNITNSTFNSNGLEGLSVGAGGSATLNNVRADANIFGAMVESPGAVHVANSSFNGNVMGLIVFGGSATLDTVTTNGNQGFGALVAADGDISIKNSTFDGNEVSGLVASSAGGNIFVSKSTFNNNTSVSLPGVGIGALFAAPGNVSVMCSDFKGNSGYGLSAVNVDGTLELGSVTFDGNGLGNYEYNGSATITSVLCNPVEGDRQKHQENILYIIVEKAQEQLPTALGEGNSFVSAVQVILTAQGQKAAKLAITLSFPIPAGMEDDDLSVMYWDGTGWVAVPGGYVANGYFVVTVSRPGFYVLVSQ